MAEIRPSPGPRRWAGTTAVAMLTSAFLMWKLPVARAGSPPDSARLVVRAGSEASQLPDAETIALHWLAEQATARRVASAALPLFQVEEVRGLASGGVRVRMVARLDGTEVRGTEVNALLGDDLRPIALSLGPAVERMTHQRGRGPTIDREEALAIALADAGLARPGTPSPLDGSPRIVRVLAVAGNGVVDDAWLCEFTVGTVAARELRHAVVDASDGTVLESRSLTADSLFEAYAEADGNQTPADGPNTDTTPYPSALADARQGELGVSSLVYVTGLNTNPDGAADPWLESDAQALSGNNAMAERDWDGNGADTTRLYGTAAGEFETAYDFEAPPDSSDAQAEASGAQAFFTVNWLHDLYYDAGFDELAGNAQDDNYERGGVDRDPVAILVQSGLHAYLRNNASMSTPSDGESPTLRSYAGTPLGQVQIHASGASVWTSTWGLGPTDTVLTGPLAWATTPDGHVDACDPVAVDLTACVALVRAGPCDLVDAALNAQAAGARGVIWITSDVGAEVPRLRFDPPAGEDPVMVPVLGVRDQDRADLEAAADASGWVTLTRPPDTDGALDSTVVAHEFGHYLHIRHVEGDNIQYYAMSEGWSDATALHMVLRDGDDLDGPYPLGTYLFTGINRLYYGVRRMPYSSDQAINGLTFRHVSTGEPLPAVPNLDNGHDNAEVHNAGEVWASALFDAYVALQRFNTTSFEDGRQKWAGIVVTALGLTPDDTTILEGRDALIAAAAAGSADDAVLMAEAFAGRGMGTCAAGPDRWSVDLAGVVEDYSVGPSPVVTEVRIDDVCDTCDSCDQDGVLDIGETGQVSVTVQNIGVVPLIGATLVLTPDDPGIAFPDGSILALPTLGPAESVQVQTAVFLLSAMAPASRHTVTATVLAESICGGQVAAQLSTVVDADFVDGGATDDFDGLTPAWTPEGDDGPDIWAPALQGDDGSWTGVARPYYNRARLISPPITVSADADFHILFHHAYRFQRILSGPADGGVLEVRVDEGDWEDVSAYAEPHYTGTLEPRSYNARKGDRAYTGTNPSWPATDRVDLDFGTALGGHTVEFAFRVVADESIGSEGWRIDDVAVQGAVSGPFQARLADAQACDVPKECGGCSTRGGGVQVSGWIIAFVFLWRRRGTGSGVE